jgi:hypothetical protein
VPEQDLILHQAKYPHRLAHGVGSALPYAQQLTHQHHFYSNIQLFHTFIVYTRYSFTYANSAQILNPKDIPW